MSQLASWTADLHILYRDENGHLDSSTLVKEFANPKDALEGLADILDKHKGASSEFHICVRWMDTNCSVDYPEGG